MTVNSSPYAVEIYMHLGFTPVSEPQEKDGIKYIPMKKSLQQSER
jgi:predicted GNAT family N-acyltransferase